MNTYDILDILKQSFLYIGLILLMLYDKYYKSQLLLINGITFIVLGVIFYILSFIMIKKDLHDFMNKHK